MLAVGRQERLPGSAHSGFDVGGLLPAPRYESGQWVERRDIADAGPGEVTPGKINH